MHSNMRRGIRVFWLKSILRFAVDFVGLNAIARTKTPHEHRKILRIHWIPFVKNARNAHNESNTYIHIDFFLFREKKSKNSRKFIG